MRKPPPGLAGAALAAALAAAVPVPAHAEAAVLHAGSPDAVPGSYIVKLADTAAAASSAASVAERFADRVTRPLAGPFHGFTATLTAREARRLAADPGVAYVEQDENGHGTHVAGLVAGTTHGAAKGARVCAVRVLNGSGSGNTSPARVAEAITVGATDQTDARAPFSNHGAGVDVYAPGTSITSAWHTGDTATNTLGGTSMATGFATGVAARYLEGDPAATPARAHAEIVREATPLPWGGRLLHWSPAR